MVLRFTKDNRPRQIYNVIDDIDGKKPSTYQISCTCMQSVFWSIQVLWMGWGLTCDSECASGFWDETPNSFFRQTIHHLLAARKRSWLEVFEAIYAFRIPNPFPVFPSFPCSQLSQTSSRVWSSAQLLDFLPTRPNSPTSSTWTCCPCSTCATTSRSVHLVEVRYTAVLIVTCRMETLPSDLTRSTSMVGDKVPKQRPNTPTWPPQTSPEPQGLVCSWLHILQTSLDGCERSIQQHLYTNNYNTERKASACTYPCCLFQNSREFLNHGRIFKKRNQLHG